MLTFDELNRVNRSRCNRWHAGGLNDWSLSDWGIATAGELGEALNIIKKLNRETDGIRGNTEPSDELTGMLADELADTAIYLDLLASRAGIDLGRAIIRKFNKTSEKNCFPDRL